MSEWTTTVSKRRKPPSRASLIKRAKQRKVRYLGGARWMVEGDSFPPEYEVREVNGEWWCECFTLTGGEYRQVHGCSHLWAARLRRHVDVVPVVPVVDVVDPEPELEPPVEVESRVIHVGEGDVPAVDDPVWTAGGDRPWPAWVEGFRPHQWEAAQEAVEHYRAGLSVVMIDAPTGSGKTVIGEMVGRLLKANRIYVCHGKTLQEQFLADFPYAKVMKGRNNYPTLSGVPGVSADDCTGGKCRWCDPVTACPYQVAKQSASVARLAVLNTSYALREMNVRSSVFRGRELGIMDECDTLEAEMFNYFEFRVTPRMLREMGLEAPKKGSHKETIAEWMLGELLPAIKQRLGQLRGDNIETIRSRARLVNLARQLGMVVEAVRVGGWVRDNDAGPLVMKPVMVGEWGEERLWSHSLRWLCMSATIISPGQWARDVGIEQGGREFGVVSVPMTFPVENRGIVVAPIADMAAKHKAESWPTMATAVARVVALHPGERVLVHSVSYDLSAYLCGRLEQAGLGRPVLTYRSARERDAIVARYRATPGAVLVAPSLDRGVDLRDDDCRVVIVAKLPFPYLGDKQVSARLHSEGGGSWYAVQTVRTLVQMTGRGVRSKDDWCKTYILDRQFMSNVWKRSRDLLPKWWRDAVNMEFDMRMLK